MIDIDYFNVNLFSFLEILIDRKENLYIIDVYNDDGESVLININIASI